MTIEIEIKSPDAFSDIYELRRLIQEAEVQGLQIKLKEQPPAEGTMSGGFLAVAGIIGAFVGEAALKTSFEMLFHSTLKSLEPAFKKFLQKLKAEGKSDVEIYTEIGDGAIKKSYVTDSNGQTSLLNSPNFAIDVHKTKVVLIGNSEFDFNFPAIKPVKGNIEDFYNLLINKKITGIPPENIIVLLNSNSGEIEEQLLLASRLPDIETLLIYYAGHGCRTDKNKLYLVAKNTKKIDDHIISGIDFDFIKNVILKQSTAAQKVLILDACHSGIATQGINDMLADFNVTGTYTFASSSSDEVSYYHPEKANTFFTGEIINVLKNGLENNKENIALDDIYETVTRNLKEKNFPEPHFKSELTIKPSDFYISHNPKFSVEAWIQRAATFHRMGKLDEALREYYLLSQRFPDDNSLKKAWENCTIDKKFIGLVNEAEELFKQKAYERSLGKYDEALAIKSDFLTLQNRNKCEQYFEIWKQFAETAWNKPVEINRPGKISENKNEAEIKLRGNDEKAGKLYDKKEPLQEKITHTKPAEVIQPGQNEVAKINNTQQGIKDIKPVKESQKLWYLAVIIHLLFFGSGLFYIAPASKRKWLYPASIFLAVFIIFLSWSGISMIQNDEYYFFRIIFFGGIFTGYFVGLTDVIINLVNKTPVQKKATEPLANRDGFKKWIYIFCGVCGLYYILLLPSMIKGLIDLFSCSYCPFYFNLKQAVFLFLVPLQLYLLARSKRTGWMVSLFSSIFQIASSVYFIVIGHNFFNVISSLFINDIVFIALVSFLIFLLRNKTMQYFAITSDVLIKILFPSLAISIIYLIYLSSLGT